MEFKPDRRKADAGCRLQMYKSPPGQSISIKEFEDLALQRLKLLQEIERLKELRSQDENTEVFYGKIINKAKQLMPISQVEEKASANFPNANHEKLRDHTSHFILRLAYCRNEEMRRWFLNNETELLKARFIKFPKDRMKFFEENKDDFDFQSVRLCDIPNEDLTQELCAFNKCHAGNNETFYKVPFLVALDLVKTRQVVLNKGAAYIHEHDTEKIASLVCNRFRARLSEELVKTLLHLSVVDDDERILPLLKKLKYRYLGEDFSAVGSKIKGQIQLSQIDSLSKESFPPCMRHLHETLRREHHLKHFARLQYGLFLKSIGLTMEQALTLWRKEFTKKMEPDKFDKNYAYNVRHSYGKEGKRANYTAYSCTKIIMGNAPGQGDCHGCPFRHWDEQHLQQMLTAHGLPHKGIQTVMEYTGDHHYQLACQKYFEITHGLNSAPFGLEHPSQFFLESRKLRGGLEGVKQENEESKEGQKQEEKEGQKQEEKEEYAMDISEQDIANFEDMED